MENQELFTIVLKYQISADLLNIIDNFIIIINIILLFVLNKKK